MSTKISTQGKTNSHDEKEFKPRQPGTSYPDCCVYIVHSRHSTDEIRAILTKLQAGEIGTIKVDYDRNGNETNRTIVVADPAVYTAAIEAGLGKRTHKLDFAITPYELREHNKPFNDCLYSFYIPFPKSFELTGQAAREQVAGMLETLVGFGLLSEDDYRITIPLKSREDGTPKGSCFITFGKEVADHVIELTKIALDHNIWLDHDEFDSWEELRCFWSRDPKQRKETRSKVGKGGLKPIVPKTVPVPLQPVTGPIVRTFTNGKPQELVYNKTSTSQ